MSGTYYPPQHGRTHCPGGSDPIPCSTAGAIPGFHAHKESTLTVVSGTESRLEWDEWIIDDTAVFEEGTLSGSDLTDIKLMQAGWYAIHCWANWSSLSLPASGFAGIEMIHDNSDITEPSMIQGHNYPDNFALTSSMSFQITRSFPIEFMQTQTFAYVDRLEFWVIQNSGVDRTLNDAYCNIAYLGTRAA